MQTTVQPAGSSSPPSSTSGRPSPPIYPVMMSTPSSVRLATSLLRIATSLFLLISFHVILSGWGAFGATLRLVNRCPFPIWPAVAPNVGHPPLAEGGFVLPPGQSRRVATPPTWSGRLWARTTCNFELSSGGAAACQTGDCRGLLACNGSIGEPPATLLQVTLQPDGRSYYDVSVVDGYNLPISVSAEPDQAGCYIGGCRGNPNMVCPPELQVRGSGRGVVACKSACLAFRRDEFCCKNAFGSEATCRPSAYSRLFKDLCPHYYSYAFDTPRPQVTCSSNSYIVTFCPPTMGARKPM